MTGLTIGAVLALGALTVRPGPGLAEYHPGGPTQPNAAQGPGQEIVGRDGATMILVPQGSFWMGSTREEVDVAIQDCRMSQEVDEATCVGWYEDEMPRHKVSLDAFYLDAQEVTHRLFAQFTAATGYLTTAEREGWAKAWVQGRGLVSVKGASWRQPEGGETPSLPHRDQHPVVSVSWEDATAYCLWAGKRLPTESEWEYAARAGTDTLFWWGDEVPHDRKVGNIADESARYLIGGIVQGYNDGYPRTSPVGSFEPNPWGLHGMIGNVAEWTQDWYGGSYKKEPEHNPQGPATGQYKVIRGGSWANGPLRARSANRDWDTPIYRHDTVGFRCAMSLPK
ncbi:MAG: formylglycine-generating enzyme family protein [Nitrospirota bacterium]|nr:formylglycine-generating enzyme family protein [Nitrospirota bacterium]MDE3224948.1 formylglycine-generating enzyme family protein [Nitrospirota bacterium]MDE3241607.1 formylglycine-generating enzyme family protein [Nitrospirota bacterium]